MCKEDESFVVGGLVVKNRFLLLTDNIDRLVLCISQVPRGGGKTPAIEAVDPQKNVVASYVCWVIS